MKLTSMAGAERSTVRSKGDSQIVRDEERLSSAILFASVEDFNILESFMAWEVGIKFEWYRQFLRSSCKQDIYNYFFMNEKNQKKEWRKKK